VSGYQVPMEKKVLMTIWTMANQEPYRTIGDRFGMNRGTAHRCVIEVTTAIRQHLYDEYIVWPTTLEMCSRNAQMFEGKYGFPGCVGCVDGSHIPMKPPANDRDSYINRKGYASVNLMAVCDHKMSFIATYAERAGSVHDARVFRVCDVGQKAARNELFPSTEFHLLGDSAYALMMQVMVPYRDNGHLTAGQKKYNVRHSATRSVIERAFGRLKGKFRRLKGLDESMSPELSSHRCSSSQPAYCTTSFCSTRKMKRRMIISTMQKRSLKNGAKTNWLTGPRTLKLNAVRLKETVQSRNETKL